MPNPFPGMNPYLERPSLWQGVHNSLITFAMGELNRVLPPNYVANIELRVYSDEIRDGFKPDVLVSETSNGFGPSHGASVAIADAPTLVLEREEIREAYLQILEIGDTWGKQTLVTSIEILSPGNKRGGEGRDEYLAKQRRVLGSETHLLEIDLLRAGQPTIAAQVSALRQNRLNDERQAYHCGLARAGGRRLHLWRVGLRERLPRLPVPLLPEDGEVSLDLQAVVNRLYDEGRFERVVNYQEEPIPPFSPEDEVWADELLKAANLRLVK